MIRRRFATWMTTFAFLSAWAALAHAQLPDGCTSADRKSAETYTNAAVSALIQRGDLARFVALLREMESGLSKTCRAALDREQPARVRCTAGERELVMRRFREIFGAATQFDLQQVVALSENLESSVSRSCWLAVNQHSDPRIRSSCSAKELDLMASYALPGTRAIEFALRTGDPSQLFQLDGEMKARVSPRCGQAVAQVQQTQQQQQARQPRKSPMQMPNVIDHGNGMLSAPGIGACSSSGCVAY